MDLHQIDSHDVARGNHQLKEAIEEARMMIEPLLIAYFFSLVPDRGRSLWRRFRRFQRRQGTDSTFGDYVLYVVYAQRLTKALMPEGCRRPHKEASRPDMQRLIKALHGVSPQYVGYGYISSLSKEQVLPAILEEMFFGRSTTYETVRRHHCITCPFRTCGHHVYHQ